jgi:predicted RNase H-like HicB family nuclease
MLSPKRTKMLLRYVETAVKQAQYKQLEDESWYAEIPGYPGVWANAANIEDCRTELIEVLEEWILLKTRAHEDIPVIEGLDINVKPVTA